MHMRALVQSVTPGSATKIPAGYPPSQTCIAWRARELGSRSRMELSEAALAEATQAGPAPTPMRPMQPMEYEHLGPAPLMAEHVAQPDTGSSSGEAETGEVSKLSSNRRWWQNESDTQKSKTYADQLRVALGQKPKEDGCCRCCPDLSWEERLMGFVGCFVIGCALSISSMFSFTELLLGYPTQFAIKLALGNVLSVSSAMFLAGYATQGSNPKRADFARDQSPHAIVLQAGLPLIRASLALDRPRTQLQKMSDPARLGASLMYLGSIVFSLVAALVLRSSLLTIVAIVLQSVALFWYGLSFVPYGRHLFQKCAGNLCKSIGSLCGKGGKGSKSGPSTLV